MSVKVITFQSSDFDEYVHVFHNWFEPDDWDYIIVGDDQDEVERLASRLTLSDHEMKYISIGDQFMYVAVTYHS
jgi:hypothetical protein